MHPFISYIPDFITHSSAWFDPLVSKITWDTRMKARATASFGVAYNYSGMVYPDAPMPEPLSEWASQIARHVGHPVNNCLVNHYPDGQSTMGFHFDSYERLVTGSSICILSLGAERTLRFRRRDDRSVTFDRPLASGSLMTMDRGVQDAWMHGLLSEDTTHGRISLTFRHIIEPAPI